MSDTSDNRADSQEHDPRDETRSAQDPLGPFDAFRARRAQEQAANEPFPGNYTQPEYSQDEPYVPEQYDDPQYEAPQYEATQYEAGQYTQPVPVTQSEVAGGRHGRLRSAAVLAGVAVLVAGVVGGVYAATQSSGSPAAATSPGTIASTTASASPTPSAGASKGAKSGKATIARLTVTSVGADSFTGTTAAGQSVSVQITQTTKFGTATRPFAREQLVQGAVVYARLRHEADGTVVATVIASATPAKGGPATATATASDPTNTGA